MTDPTPTSGFGQFMAEMRRRHVVRFALGYSAAAFVVLQLAEIVFPAFGIGEGGLRLLVVVTALGFPPSLVLAWMYDLTTEGIQRTDGIGSPSPLLPRLALGALLLATIVVAGSLGLYLSQQGVFESPDTAEESVTPPVRLAEYDPEAPIRSIAVLPLADFSPDGDQAYFAAGMHEEIIAKLSSLDGIRVVSRTSVMRYSETTLSIPEIGRELDVDVLVEGSVSRTDDHIRVTLQLIHAPSDSHIKTLQWDREDVEDVLAFQTEIAHGVVEAVAVKHNEETDFVQTAEVDPAAQDAYFRGRYEYERGTPEGYRAAEQYFQAAIAADSDFAPARAGIAGARLLMGLDDARLTQEELAQARQEALAALALDSASVEALDVLALIDRSNPTVPGAAPDAPDADPPKTVHVLRGVAGLDSIVIDPGAYDTTWVASLSSLGERIESRMRQTGIDMGNTEATPGTVEARRLMTAGRYPEAVRRLEEVVRQSPGSDLAWEMLVRAHITLGDAYEAADVVASWAEAGGERAPSEAEAAALRGAIDTNGVPGFWRWNLARLEELRADGVDVPSMDLAATNAALGNDDEALAHLADALEAGEPGVFSIRSDPVWDDLRSDPRLQAIAHQARALRLSRTRRDPAFDPRPPR